MAARGLAEDSVCLEIAAKETSIVLGVLEELFEALGAFFVHRARGVLGQQFQELRSGLEGRGTHGENGLGKFAVCEGTVDAIEQAESDSVEGLVKATGGTTGLYGDFADLIVVSVNTVDP